MRPIVRALEQRGAEVLDHGARLRADARAVRAPRARLRGDRPPPRRPPGRQGRRPALALDGARCAGRAGARIDIALGHGSNDVTVAARLLGIPSATAFDYEWAQGPAHRQLPARARDRRARRDPARAPARRTAPRRRSSARYPGLKEEYYLADFEPDPAVLGELGLDPARPIAVVRTPPAVSLYHRFENPLFASVLDRLRPRADRRAPAHARAARRARAASSSPSGRSTRSRWWRSPTSWSRRAAR